MVEKKEVDIKIEATAKDLEDEPKKDPREILIRADKRLANYFAPVLAVNALALMGVILYVAADGPWKYFGVFVFAVALMDLARREGFRKGYMNGYDDGVNDSDTLIQSFTEGE